MIFKNFLSKSKSPKFFQNQSRNWLQIWLGHKRLKNLPTNSTQLYHLVTLRKAFSCIFPTSLLKFKYLKFCKFCSFWYILSAKKNLLIFYLGDLVTLRRGFFLYCVTAFSTLSSQMSHHVPPHTKREDNQYSHHLLLLPQKFFSISLRMESLDSRHGWLQLFFNLGKMLHILKGFLKQWKLGRLS